MNWIIILVGLLFSTSATPSIDESTIDENAFMLLISPLSTADDLLEAEKLLEGKEAEVTLSEINFDSNGQLASLHASISSENCIADGKPYNHSKLFAFEEYPIIMIFVSPECQNIGMVESGIDAFDGLVSIFGFEPDGKNVITTWDGGVSTLKTHIAESNR